MITARYIIEFAVCILLATFVGIFITWNMANSESKISFHIIFRFENA